MICGLMGGTFDPVHRGHIEVAKSALFELGLERLIFLPDGDPPHKKPLASGPERLLMLRLACREDSRFAVSDMEIKRAGKTYTVDTLKKLKEQSPHDEFVYLIGSDTLSLFPTWRTAHEVARLCRMAVVLRPGDVKEEVEVLQQKLQEVYGLRTVLLKEPGLPISSSLVREAVQMGEDISALVSPDVAAYIKQRGLYKTERL